jgi:hypothetical protein
MNQMLRGAWVRAGAVFAALCLAPACLCLAGDALPVPGGGLMTIEIVGLDRMTPDAGGPVLTWTLAETTGVRAGIVPSTSGPEPDVTPVLAPDPRTGAPVLIWSHWNGQAMKLAWSRFDSGTWSEARDVTFGPGNDRTPAVGLSSAGAYLFFWRDNARVMYAPIDLGTGRLFAAPRLLTPAVLKGRDWTPNGGTDVPILIGTCGAYHNAPCVGTGLPPVLPSVGHGVPGIEGGADVPIIHSGSESPATSISVASQPDCRTMVVGLARSADPTQRIVAFDGAGRAWLVARVVPDGVSPAAALAASTAHFLGSVCR